MELALLVYLAGVADDLKAFFVIFGAVTSICSFIYLIVLVDESKPWNKKYLLIPIFSFVISTIIPTERILYMMAGAYAGQQALESETASKIVKVINIKLDKYLVEIEKNVSGEKK